jgi:hypothetical protein
MTPDQARQARIETLETERMAHLLTEQQKADYIEGKCILSFWQGKPVLDYSVSGGQ